MRITDNVNKVPDDSNDGEMLLERLCSLNEVDLRNYLLQIADPCAFVYHSATTRSTFFGRDVLGRRSLVMSAEGELMLSSVPDPSISWEECDATYLYELQADKTLLKHKRSSVMKLNRDFTDIDQVVDIPTAILDLFRHFLTQAVSRRVNSIPTHNDTMSALRNCKVAVLFSGGIDCTMG